MAVAWYKLIMSGLSASRTLVISVEREMRPHCGRVSLRLAWTCCWTVEKGEALSNWETRSPSASRRDAATLAPELPVQHAVVDRFADVFGLDFRAAIQVGNRSGDAQDFVMRAGGKPHLLDAGP